MSVFPRPVTSADVAARLGVSRSTVSLALSGSPRVSAAMRERVHVVSAEIGYRPLAAGRRLRTGRSGTVGVLLPALGFEAFDRIVSGIREGLSDAQGPGHALLLGITGNDVDEQHALAAVVDTHDFDALVLVAVADPSDATLRRFAGRVVALESASDVVPSAGYDLAAAAGDVVGHLAALGHRRLAHLAVDTDKRAVRPFRDALRAAAAAAGQDVLAVPCDDWTGASALSAITPVLDGGAGSRPTAVVCDDARQALAVLAAARRAGLDVPGDLSLVCGHLEDLTELAHPVLTGLERPAVELGRVGAAAVRRLVADLPVELPPPLTCRLVEGASSGPAPTASSRLR